MDILSQFLFQLSFGLALAMGLTPSKLVTSGFYRVHILVVLGLMTLAALVTYSQGELENLWPAVAAAILSYVCSVAWVYEKKPFGTFLLFVVSGLALYGGLITGPAQIVSGQIPESAVVLRWLTVPSGGLILGTTMAAMLLGHWYLNTPTMELEPLKRLVLMVAAATILRILISGIAGGLEISAGAENLPLGQLFWPLLSIRWLAGLLGILVLAWMTWQTLKVPNTQSATGILYVAVIGTFVGELASQLLSAEAVFPL